MEIAAFVMVGLAIQARGRARRVSVGHDVILMARSDLEGRVRQADGNSIEGGTLWSASVRARTQSR